MESELIFAFVLHVDGEARRPVGRTLQEAQDAAIPFLSSASELRIVSFVAPAPSRTWVYDRAVNSWVERI